MTEAEVESEFKKKRKPPTETVVTHMKKKKVRMTQYEASGKATANIVVSDLNGLSHHFNECTINDDNQASFLEKQAHTQGKKYGATGLSVFHDIYKVYKENEEIDINK
eukprot:15334020-Ditylum_brightwellii.AAC.1